MKIYLVGGAVRDEMLGLPVKERDYVVVNATVEDMLKLGYQQVGKEFPVFLHPKTREEYALARMERKVKPGYKGFTFDTSTTVTLEEDLLRRDLTINAMAKTIPDGVIIDPYHGEQDLKDKILRHVSPAFVEDPVRILRVGRFWARYAHLGFRVHDDTIALMRKMVESGEVDALVAERVWKEWERALGEKHPEKFFELLTLCGAIEILFPEFGSNYSGIFSLIAAAKITNEPMIRFAALLHALPDSQKNLKSICNRYRVPNAYRELALLTARHYESAKNAQSLTAQELLNLFSALDIYRRPDRFKHFLLACQSIANAQRQSFDDRHWLGLEKAANIAAKCDIKDVLAQGLEGNALAKAIQDKRKDKVQEWLAKQKPTLL